MARDGTGRRGRKRREPSALAQLPWRAVRNPYAPIEVLSEDQLEAIHDTSMRILEEIGMDFLHAEARAILAAAGAERVGFDRGLIAQALSHAPACFRLHARNPARNLTIGDNHINFATVGSAPNVSDLARGRRDGNYEDYCDLIRLAQAFNIVHFMGGYPVEPVDLPPATRHLDAKLAFITLSDKAFHGYSLGRTRILDVIEMTRIARGLSEAELAREPRPVHRGQHLLATAPGRADDRGRDRDGAAQSAGRAHALHARRRHEPGDPRRCARAAERRGAGRHRLHPDRQPGRAGGLRRLHLERGHESGAPAFGTPEYTRAALASGQLARRYRLPYRSSNANAANLVDAQAAYESEMSLWGAVMGHANIVMHGAGWLEGGLCASFEKFILDVELLQTMAEFLRPIEVDEATLGLSAIREVQPGGHFFGAAHTLERYETAFYAPLLSDWRNYETWEEGGSLTATERAHKIYKQVLAEFEPPPLDGAIKDELEDFVARRKREGGAAAA